MLICDKQFENYSDLNDNYQNLYHNILSYVQLYH